MGASPVDDATTPALQGASRALVSRALRFSVTDSTSRMQVALSAVGYASTHLSVYGFPQLAALGVLLGSLHVYASRNLLLPTITHSLFNTVILGAVLLSLPPQSMVPALPPVPGVTQ